MKERFALISMVAALCVGTGCTRDTEQAEVTAKADTATLTAAEVLGNPALLHQRLLAANPAYRGGAQLAQDPQAGLIGQINVTTVSDISGLQGIPFGALDLRGLPITTVSPLKGMPLKLLGLEGTRVTDLSPLAGAPLVKLYLNDTAVSDLTPLKGMPLGELMLANTLVSDLTPLTGAPLQMLWFNKAPVTDIGPIAKCPLLSLTLEGTEIADLKPLSGNTTLKRLHIGGTKVTDLSPLKGLQLERLIFTPGNIKTGLEIAREMTSLKEIGTTLEGRMPPSQFWADR
jgi:internalin A